MYIIVFSLKSKKLSKLEKDNKKFFFLISYPFNKSIALNKKALGSSLFFPFSLPLSLPLCLFYIYLLKIF